MVFTNTEISRQQAQYNITWLKTATADSLAKYLGARLINAYCGHATDANLRHYGASGGVVTAMIQAYLYTWHNTVAVTLGEDQIPRVYKFNEVDWIGQGSHYTTRLQPLPDSEKCKVPSGSPVIVSLPCQVKYWRKLYPEAIIIGLFCSHAVEEEGIDRLARYSNIVPGDHGIIYREKAHGTTGLYITGLKVVQRGFAVAGNFIPIKEYWGKYLNFCYIPKSCLACTDLTAEMADISVGDAHGHKEFYKGKNVIITRSVRGERLLNTAREFGAVDLAIINPTIIINTQPYIAVKKHKYNMKTRIYVSLRAIGCYMSTHKGLIGYLVYDPIMRLWAKQIAKKGYQVNGL